MPEQAVDEQQFESPVPEITAPIPTPQRPGVEPVAAPMQPAPRVVQMPSRQLFDQQQRDKQEADYLKSVYQQAQTLDQAVKDVSSARRMLGLLKADREIKSGVPVEKAMYNNLQYFTQPGQTGFAPTMKALQPPRPAPMPTQMNVPGMAGPVLVDQRGVPHFAPRTAMNQPEFKASVEEIAPGVRAAKLGPNHYQLLDRPNVKGSLSAVVKTQVQLWRDSIKALRDEKKTGADSKLIDPQIAQLEQKIMGAAQGVETPSRTATTNTGVVLRRKSDGKQFRYKGNAGDVPKDQFDIVGESSDEE